MQCTGPGPHTGDGEGTHQAGVLVWPASILPELRDVLSAQAVMIADAYLC